MLIIAHIDGYHKTVTWEIGCDEISTKIGIDQVKSITVNGKGLEVIIERCPMNMDNVHLERVYFFTGDIAKTMILNSGWF